MLYALHIVCVLLAMQGGVRAASVGNSYKRVGVGELLERHAKAVEKRQTAQASSGLGYSQTAVTLAKSVPDRQSDRDCMYV